MSETKEQQRTSDVESAIATTTAEIRSLHSEVADIKQSLAVLSDQIQVAGRTPWPTLLGGIAVMLSLSGMVGAIYVAGVNDFKEAIIARINLVEDRLSEARERIAERSGLGDELTTLRERQDNINRRQGYNEKAIKDLETFQNRRLDAEAKR